MQEKNPLDNRLPLDKILKSKATIERIGYIQEILFSLSSVICIINKNDQLVFTNDVLLEKYGIDIETSILGKRTGEFLNCENASNDTGGCGTSRKCVHCGAHNAIHLAWKNKQKTTREAKITARKDGISYQLDIELTASPLFFEEEFLIISMEDISERKHKKLLERIFFHDILNIAGSLSGVIHMFPELPEDERDEYYMIMNSLSGQIIDEIKAQQLFIKAESGELSVKPREIEIDDFLVGIINKMKFHQVAYDKNIVINNLAKRQIIRTDPTLLTRTLINMCKNALEAVDFKEKVTITAKKTNKSFVFQVHNNSHIPLATQDQIFKRSFSTKDTGRGLGTYSMKLIIEKYLHGKVGFISNAKDGTTFYAQLPHFIESNNTALE